MRFKNKKVKHTENKKCPKSVKTNHIRKVRHMSYPPILQRRKTKS